VGIRRKGAAKMKLKKCRVSALIIGIVSLIIGASFHGLRMHPENASAYHLGCTMGIILAVIAVVTLVTFAALLIISKTGNKGSRRR
jgi:predicted membrane channel-forming protein YqfA (hemolysin III family)